MQPELIQVILSLIIVVTGYIKIRGKIESAAAAALAREDKIKSDALARESKIKSDALEREKVLTSGAEQIQQDAQRIVNDIALKMQIEMGKMQSKHDDLQGKFNTLITDHASLSSDHAILKQSFIMLERQNREGCIERTKIAGELKELSGVKSELEKSERLRSELVANVSALDHASILQGERILSLEKQVELLGQQIALEQQLRTQAEDIAKEAKTRLLSEQLQNGQGQPVAEETIKPIVQEGQTHD